MSKSDPDSKSRIEITDDPDTVVEKCKKAITDFTSAVTYEPTTRPAVANLITLHCLCTGMSPDEVCENNRGLTTAQYKLVVAEVVNEFLRPIRQNYDDLLKDPCYLINILDEGAGKAASIAHETWAEVKKAVGFAAS